MYDERIESLIKAALADGELTEKEKQILFKNAEAQGIDLDEFEMILDARLVEQKKAEQEKQEKLKIERAKAEAQAKPAAPKSSKFGDVRKCPACGAILQSFQTKCDDCGYEFKNIESVQSSQKLFDLLQAADLRKAKMLEEHKKEKERRLDELSKRHNNVNSFVKILGGKSREKQLDEEREDLIREMDNDCRLLENKADEEKFLIVRNYPVPNSKEDLLELLSMATSNAYDNDRVIGKQEEAWLQKADQIYQKIVVCSSNDMQFLEQATQMVLSLMKRLPQSYKNFTTIPAPILARANDELKSHQEYQNKMNLQLIMKYAKWGGPCAVIAFLFFFLGAQFESNFCLWIAMIFGAPAGLAYYLYDKERKTI